MKINMQEYKMDQLESWLPRNPLDELIERVRFNIREYY